MNEINSSTFTKNAKINLELLGKIDYTGRGLIIGKSPDDKNLIHVYWISGRSENSKNRIFVKDSNNFVRTEAFDETKVEDPSLIIYYPLMHIDNLHFLSNGDQTTTIYNFLKNNKPYEQAIQSRTFEPDPPHYTPRISGISDLSSNKIKYQISIIKSFQNNSDCIHRNFYSYSKSIAGMGHCITVYQSNGEPLPSYSGEPFILPLYNSIDKNLTVYWEKLNVDRRISILVKFVNLFTQEIQIAIKNKLSK